MKCILSRKWIVTLIAIACSISTLPVVAADSCQGRFADPINSVCWECLFPISIGSMKVTSSKLADTKNPSSPLCACGRPIPRIGISAGFWEPISLVDVTSKPFCMVNLGGFELGMSQYYPQGTQNTKQGGNNHSFYHAHWYKFPLMLWLNLLTSAVCMQAGDFDLAYMTELDPTWNSNLALILNPEAVLFANPVAQASCAADALASSAHKPLNLLFWCAGSQGSMYPLSGFVQEHASGSQATTLLAERLSYKMHRELLLWDSGITGGPLGSQPLCSQRPHPIIPKDRYRYQMTFPVAATKSIHGCKPFGSTTALWEGAKEFPVKGEDFGYLIWRKRNCCVL